MRKKFVNVYQKYNNVILVTRENGIRKDIEYEGQWYFLIDKKDKNKLKGDWFENLEDENEYTKVYPKIHRDRKDVIERLEANDIKTYEGDLSVVDRFLIDNDLELDTNQKTLYFDIETSDRKPGINPGEEQILSFAGVDSDNKETFYLLEDDNEVDLLKKIVKLFESYDLIAGWFSEKFDLVVIKKRCDLLGVQFDCNISTAMFDEKEKAKPTKVNHIDLMSKLQKIRYRDTELIKRVKGFGLNAVAKEFLSEEKTETKGTSLQTLYDEDPERLQEYNMQDARLCKRLDEKLSISKQALIEQSICGARVNDYANSKKLDLFVLRFANKRGLRLPTNMFKRKSLEDNPQVGADESDKKGRKRALYEGGYVLDPKVGLYKNLHIFDFKSLYPSIIRTFNISLETFLRKSGEKTHNKDEIFCPETNCYYKKEPAGVIPQVLKYLIDERNNIRGGIMKTLNPKSFEYQNYYYRQYSFKVLANSMYGVLGAEFVRYFKVENAESITGMGRWLIKKVMAFAESRGLNVIYCDTDSVFLTSEDPAFIPEDFSKESTDYINKVVTAICNIGESDLFLDYKETCPTFLMVDKKRYAWTTKDGEIQAMGLEVRRRDTLKFAETQQKKLFDLLLKENTPVEEIKKWIEELRSFVMDKHLQKEDVTLYKRLGQEIDHYKTSNPQVRVAKWIREKQQTSEKINLYSQGAYIPMIYVEEEYNISKETGQSVTHPDLYVNGSYSAEYYWNTPIYGILERILKAAYPSENWDNYFITKRELKNKHQLTLI